MRHPRCQGKYVEYIVPFRPADTVLGLSSTASVNNPAQGVLTLNAGRFVTCRLTSRLRLYIRARPKRATQEPVDHANGPESEDGAKRNGYLHDKLWALVLLNKKLGSADRVLPILKELPETGQASCSAAITRIIRLF